LFSLSSTLAFKHLRSLLELILTNSEVRKFITDFSVIGRDQLSRGATKMAGTIGLSDERFRNVNQSASNSDSPLGDKQKGVRSGVSQTGVECFFFLRTSAYIYLFVLVGHRSGSLNLFFPRSSHLNLSFLSG